jgi:hypothetical protein
MLVPYLNGHLVGDVNRTDPDNFDVGDWRAIGEFVRQLQKLDSLKAAKGGRKKEAEFEETLIWIKNTLKKYNATPDFNAERGLPTWEWDIYWHVVGERISPQNIELQMTLFATELLRSGRISALKQCLNCGNWLFARFSHQVFCTGGDCYKQFHKRNPADKKRRNEWAKKDYWKRKVNNAVSRRTNKRSRLQKQS